MHDKIQRSLTIQPGIASVTDRSAQIETLTQVNINDMLAAIGLSHVRHGRWLLELLCQRPARRFAREVLTYDEIVGVGGLQAGGAWALNHFIKHVVVSGQENIPRNGPLLLVANHPGLCDAVALFAHTPRPDLRVVALDRPFVRALSHTEPYLFYVRESATGRSGVIRAIARHLRAGGAVLTFPNGHVEPDPAVLPGAVASLHNWSTSVDLFARLASPLTIVPVIISGVLSPAALRHPLTHIRRRQEDRELLAAMLQILLPQLQDVTVRVTFGRPIAIRDLPTKTDTTAVSKAVLAEARRLIEQCTR